jgi:hypothetical protein
VFLVGIIVRRKIAEQAYRHITSRCPSIGSDATPWDSITFPPSKVVRSSSL